MYEDLVSGRYKRHMAQLSRRPDQLKTPLLWKLCLNGSWLLFWMAKFAVSHSKCDPNLAQRKLFHSDILFVGAKKDIDILDLCGEFSFGFALDGHRLSPLRFRQSVMVFHIPGQLLIDTQCSEPTPQCETVNWSLGPCLQMNSDQPPYEQIDEVVRQVKIAITFNLRSTINKTITYYYHLLPMGLNRFERCLHEFARPDDKQSRSCWGWRAYWVLNLRIRASTAPFFFGDCLA